MGQYGTWRGGDIGTALYRVVVSTTLTYYHSFRTPPTTKRSVRASTARGEVAISVPHCTWRGGDAGTVLHRAVLSSTLPNYQNLTWLSNSTHNQESVRASTVHGDVGIPVRYDPVQLCAVLNTTYPYRRSAPPIVPRARYQPVRSPEATCLQYRTVSNNTRAYIAV